jgi:hypothetical protein
VDRDVRIGPRLEDHYKRLTDLPIKNTAEHHSTGRLSVEDFIELP